MLLKKNPNEKNYPGRKKHFFDVIKNSGEANLLFWRQPEEDFNTQSTLIVMPGEQAIFIHNGVIEGVFDEGTYKLPTENIPFFSRLRNAFSGGISSFHCVVCFIKKSVSVEIRWGTSSPIQIRDRKLGIATTLKANGAYQVEITDPALFASHLIGNRVSSLAPDELQKYFMAEFQGTVRSVISQTIAQADEEILGIDARLKELSSEVCRQINATFSTFGLKCERFSFAEILIDDHPLRAKYDEITMEVHEKVSLGQAEAEVSLAHARAEADAAIMKAHADAERIAAIGHARAGVMQEMGESGYRQQAMLDTVEKIAENGSGNGTLSSGAEIGMGLAAMGQIAATAKNALAPTENTPTDPVVLLSKLKQMLDGGLITEAEYDQKKTEILQKMH